MCHETEIRAAKERNNLTEYEIWIRNQNEKYSQHKYSDFTAFFKHIFSQMFSPQSSHRRMWKIWKGGRTAERGGGGGAKRRGGGEGGGCAAQSLIDDSLYAQHHPHGEEPPVIHCTLQPTTLYRGGRIKNTNIDTAHKGDTAKNYLPP